jgi:hypothetical protein
MSIQQKLTAFIRRQEVEKMTSLSKSFKRLKSTSCQKSWMAGLYDALKIFNLIFTFSHHFYFYVLAHW